MIAKLLLLQAIATILLGNATFAESTSPHVGVILPISGPFSRFGARIRSLIQEQGDNSFNLSYEDEGCAPLQATHAYKRLSEQQGIHIFLGPWCGSPQTVVASQIAARNEVAVLGSSAPERVFALSKEKMFSSQPSIESESQFNSQYLWDKGYRRVVLLFFENDFSRAHESAFRASFKGEVVKTLTYTTQDQSSLASLVLMIKQIHPDLLYVPDALPILGNLIHELQSIGLKSLPVHSVYSVQSPELVLLHGISSHSFTYSYPDIGEKEAIEYFPSKAIDLLKQAMMGCESNAQCIAASLKSNNYFDGVGAPKGSFTVKSASHR